MPRQKAGDEGVSSGINGPGKKFRQQYEKEKTYGKVSAETQFSFAWCLVRSTNKQDLQLGVKLLEELYHKTKDEAAKRDYLFYIAVGFTRLREFNEALKFSKAILSVEPGNHQAMELTEYIQKKQKKDALIGVAVVGAIGGAAAVAVTGLIGLGIALARK